MPYSNLNTAPHNTRRRSSSWPKLLITTLLLGGVTLATTTYFSNEAQKTLTTLPKDFNLQIANQKIIETQQISYKKGIFRSNQILEASFLLNNNAQPFKVILHNTVQHGPILGTSGIGQAKVTTRLEFADSALQQKMNEVFNDRPPTIETRVDLLGQRHSRLLVPSGKITTQSGETVSWHALTASSNGPQLSNNAMLDIPYFAITNLDDTEKLLMENLTLRSQQQGNAMAPITQLLNNSGKASQNTNQDRQYPLDESLLGLGKTHFGIKLLMIHSESENLVLKDLNITSESNKNGSQHYDFSNKYALKTLQSGQQMFKDMKINIKLEHLAIAPLLEILTALNALSDTENPVSEPWQEQQLQRNLLRLLSDNASLNIERLSLNHGNEETFLQAKLSAPKLAEMNALQLRLLLSTPQFILPLLQIESEGRIGEKILTKLSNENAPNANSGLTDKAIGRKDPTKFNNNINWLLEMLLDNEILQKDDQHFVYKLKYNDSGLFINDKQFGF